MSKLGGSALQWDPGRGLLCLAPFICILLVLVDSLALGYASQHILSGRGCDKACQHCFT